MSEQHTEVTIDDLVDQLRSQCDGTIGDIRIPSNLVQQLLGHIDHLAEAATEARAAAMLDQQSADAMEELLVEECDSPTLGRMLVRYRSTLETIADKSCKSLQQLTMDCMSLSPNIQTHWCSRCLATHTLSQDSLLLGQEGEDSDLPGESHA